MRSSFCGFSDQRIAAAVLTLSLQFGFTLSMLNIPFSHITLLGGWCSSEDLSSPDTMVPTKCPNATFVLSWCQVAVMGGAAIGALGTMLVVSRGRVLTMKLAHIWFILSSLLMLTLRPNVFIMGRLCQGLGMGVVSVVGPMYVSEMSRPEARGKRLALNQLVLTFGIFFAMLVAYPLAPLPDVTSPRVMDSFQRSLLLGILAFPGFNGSIGLMLHQFLFREETPAYLALNFDSSNANRVFRAVVGTDTRDAELPATSSGTSMNLRALFSDVLFLKILGVAVGLSVGQQLSGINVFLSMSNRLFSMAGVPDDMLNATSIIVSFVNMIMTIPAIILLDKIGKKQLLMGGILGQTLALGAVALATFIVFLAPVLPSIASLGVCFFVMSFSIGYGPILWVHLPEMFPEHSKGTGIAVAVFTNWSASMVVLYISASASESAETLASKFRLFFLCSGLSYIFVRLFMLEPDDRRQSTGTYCSPYVTKYQKPSVDAGESVGLSEEERLETGVGEEHVSISGQGDMAGNTGLLRRKYLQEEADEQAMRTLLGNVDENKKDSNFDDTFLNPM